MAWLKRKPKNHRVKQRNVLDVKMSVAQVRRARFRALAYTTITSAIVLFAIYVCYRAGDWLLDHLIYENPAYALRELSTQTDGVISAEQIRRWAGVKPGENLFTLDLARVKRDLELVPAIQAVAVERVLPSSLRIRVTEREPVAQIVTTVMRGGTAAQSVVFLLDRAGHVMLPLEPRQRAIPAQPGERCPVLTGANFSELTPGRCVESPQIRAALRLMAEFERSPMAGLVELERIDVASPEVLLVTTDHRSAVALRTDDLERQLHRWRLIHDVGVQQGRQIGSLDLSVTENIPLRWLEAGAVPPAAPKPKRTSPYRKKHV